MERQRYASDGWHLTGLPQRRVNRQIAWKEVEKSTRKPTKGTY